MKNRNTKNKIFFGFSIKILFIISFLDIELSKKVAFVSEYFEYTDKDLSKNKLIRTIPKELSDNDKKSSPNGNKLYQICGTI